jgi:hypothetical protein
MFGCAEKNKIFFSFVQEDNRNTSPVWIQTPTQGRDQDDRNTSIRGLRGIRGIEQKNIHKRHKRNPKHQRGPIPEPLFYIQKYIPKSYILTKIHPIPYIEAFPANPSPNVASEIA